MAELNHTIVWCSDAHRSSAFLAEILGLPAPRPFKQFQVVDVANGVSLDFHAKKSPIAWQHYAFLVSDAEFVAAMARLLGKGVTFSADNAGAQPGTINHRDGGRGLYFKDSDGHLLELITKPYATEF